MQSPTPPKKWKLAVLVWFFIYPAITILFFLLAPLMEEWPFYLRTMLLTIILVPAMVFFALPFINKNCGDWIRK